MSKKSSSKRVFRVVFNAARLFVRFLSFLAVLLVCAFIFLRLYGVPKPILREIIQRVNAAGIPVNIDSVMLTLRGWRASGVTYYSRHPDDLEPIFHAREVLLLRKRELEEETTKGWKIDIEATDIELSPSVEWGVSIPKESAVRHVDSIQLTLGMLPDRIEFYDGAMSWIGIEFKVNGTVFKKHRKTEARETGDRPAIEKKQKTVLPVYISAQQFQSLEDRLKQLQLNGGAEMKVQFSVDADDYAKNALKFSLDAQQVSIRGVGFDGMELSGHYVYPELQLDEFRASKNGKSLSIDAKYDLDSKLIQANLKNTISSRKLLLLTPQPVVDLLVKAQLQFEELPQFSLRIGPALVKDIPNALSGSFSIRDVTYCGLLIESAKGNLERRNNFLDLTELHATVAGQEERSEEVGSALHGGSAQGRVFWDASKKTFGVKAEGSMDPNLFLQPLSIVPVATNSIGRFQFLDEMPQISLELGSSYVDWSTFFINVHGMGNQVRVHDGLVDSMNTSAYYSNALLRLDPIAVMSGVDFMKGTASIDFYHSTTHFDVFGSLSPDLLEDLTYADFNLFGNKIQTIGSTQIKARGALDWKTMQATDFRAEVETERLEIPVAAMDSFSAVVSGIGSKISVSNALFSIYNGKGNGAFSILLDPGSKEMPYSIDLDVEDADLKKCLEFLKLPCKPRTRGKIFSKASITADMIHEFFETANGNGSVSIKDGELADMPLFTGFSNLMRIVVPGFRTFSVTGLNLDFELKDGDVYTQNASFEGDVFSAKAKGKYSKHTGHDVKVQVQMLNNKGLSKVIRVITDPFFKLFELRLSGTLSDPSWRLENFSSGSASTSDKKETDESN